MKRIVEAEIGICRWSPEEMREACSPESRKMMKWLKEQKGRNEETTGNE